MVFIKGYWTVFCVVCFVLLVAPSSVLPHPVESSRDNRNGQTLTEQQLPLRTSMKLIGDVTHFLRTWFRNLTAYRELGQHQTLETRSKRRSASGDQKPESPDIQVNQKESNESSFETYEKNYLVNQTLNYLKQIYYYSEYRQKMRQNGGQSQPDGESSSTNVPTTTTDDTNRVSSLLSEKMNELTSMTLDQLEKIFASVRRAAKSGVEDPGITSLCCPQG